jgi:hypothetical protein
MRSVTIIALSSLFSCATQLPQRADKPPRFGFTDAPAGPGVFHLRFAADYDTHFGLLEENLLFHGAMVARAHGFTYFTMSNYKAYMYRPPEEEYAAVVSTQFYMEVQEATVACFAQNPDPFGLVYKATDVMTALADMPLDRPGHMSAAASGHDQ